jgi:hexosaminidase
MHREAGAPLRHIHMGGDEVPNGVWVGSPAVQSYMQAHGLTNVDDLWFAFYGRVEQLLKAQGLEPSGWEEIAVRKTQRDGRRTNIPNPDFASRGWRAYVWNNVPGWGAEDLAYRLANGGYDVVLSPVTNLYFDLAWNQNPGETGLDWGGYVDLRKPFDFIPLDYYRNARLDRRGNPLDPAVFAGKDRLTDYGRAEVVWRRGAGVGTRPRLGDGARRRKVRGALSRRLVALRQRDRRARAATTRPRGPRSQLPDSHPGSEG